MKNKILCVLQVRGGSKGVPKKVSRWWPILFNNLKAELLLVGEFLI